MLYHRDTLKACTLAASPDETRPGICGVHLDGKVAVATDGFILVAIQNDAPPDEEFPKISGDHRTEPVTIPTKALLDACKATPRKTMLPVLECVAIATDPNPDKVRIVATDLDSTHDASVRHCGTFPNWRQVMPKEGEESKVTVGLTVHVVLKLFKALEAAGVESVAVRIGDPMKPLLVRGTTGRMAAVEATLMPARLGEYGVLPPAE